ncbi:MAG: hypothetical protein JSV95_06305 [Gemmatimonadota bacterium]|nr:MAG: hypothetical protein JSV95_06305 [Gemmatimonadota bacterium]
MNRRGGGRAVGCGIGLALLVGCEGPTEPPPPPNLDLRIGETAIVSGGAQLSEILLRGGSGPREYRIAVQSASRLASGSWPMSLTGTAVAPAAAAAADRGQGAGSAQSRPAEREEERRLPAEGDLWGLHAASELRLRSAVRRELQEVGARPVRLAQRAEDALGARPLLRAALSAEVPVVGERREFLFSVQRDLTVSCTDTVAVIQAVAKAVGERFAIYRDLQAPGWFSAADYAEMLATLDGTIYPVNSSYFGEPADIDGNERVVVLITEETNKLSSANGLTFIAGFFVPSDLSDSGPGGGGTAAGGVCATSNEAEILYLIAPDPGGEFGRRHSTAFAKETVIGVSAHEFQHLINAEQRLIVEQGDFGDLEESWIDEGLSHLAEELSGLAAAGLPLRSNLTFDEATASADIFERFHLDNFSRLGQTSGCGGWLRSPEDTRTIAADDPGGCSGLRYRGFAWLFMRWLGDHEGPAGSGVIPGSDEAVLFRELVGGGPSRLTGIANIERAVEVQGSGRGWEALLADFLIAPAGDDRVDGAPPRTQILSWDLPDVFFGLHATGQTSLDFTEPYPLDMEALGFTSFQRQFAVRSSTAKYFSLASEATVPDFELQLLDTAGLPLSSDASAQLTILRVR